MARAGEDLLVRIQGEYREMPGLRLTSAQAERLWGLDRSQCESVMADLVDSAFLTRRRDGSYVRVDANSPVTRGAGGQAAKADGRAESAVRDRMPDGLSTS